MLDMKKIVLSLSISLTVLSGFSDTYTANMDLKRAFNELEAAKTYVNEASRQDPKNNRVVFHYKYLISDIDKLEAGINEKFMAPRIQPRIVKPLKGDYLGIVGEVKK